MIYNNCYRHIIFVDFVRTVNDYNFLILDENIVDILVDKKQIFDLFVDSL